jgi:DNA-binding SARP family transcriptional activator
VPADSAVIPQITAAHDEVGMPIRLQVLGGLRAFHDDVQLGWVPPQRIRSALLVYLALEREATRKLLARTFWPDDEPENARHALSQLLYLLRQALGDSVIETAGETVRFGIPVVCDALEFERAAERGELALAASLYRGAFLKDVGLSDSREFTAWVDRERARYGRLYRRTCRGIIQDLLEEQKLAAALDAARGWATLEPFEDEAQHRLIELLSASGQRSEALQQYELYERLLAGEGLEPLEETRKLVAQLRAAELGAGSFAATSIESPRKHEVAPAAAVRDTPAAGRTARGEAAAAGELFAALERELGPELELLRPLGEGRTGRVFLAREARLNRLVAVKVMASEAAADQVALARFEREARAAASLNHPHAVQVYRFGYLASGIPYLVLQYVRGGTLEDRLTAEGPLPVHEARRVLAAVADALAAAHHSGFVHRDMRPNNVLCDEDGRVLVSDFGLAGVLPEVHGSVSPLTGAGEVLGNVEYCSPEQLRGEETSEKSDVYALGVLGYWTLAGEGPFRASRESDLMTAHLRAPPRPLMTLRPDVDPALSELLERCLAKDPVKRPRAAFLAQALRAESQAAGSGAGMPPRRPAWWLRLRSLLQPRR